MSFIALLLDLIALSLRKPDFAARQGFLNTPSIIGGFKKE